MLAQMNHVTVSSASDKYAMIVDGSGSKFSFIRHWRPSVFRTVIRIMPLRGRGCDHTDDSQFLTESLRIPVAANVSVQSPKLHPAS